jgi:hypothetical protein
VAVAPRVRSAGLVRGCVAPRCTPCCPEWGRTCNPPTTSLHPPALLSTLRQSAAAHTHADVSGSSFQAELEAVPCANQMYIHTELRGAASCSRTGVAPCVWARARYWAQSDTSHAGARSSREGRWSGWACRLAGTHTGGGCHLSFRNRQLNSMTDYRAPCWFDTGAQVNGSGAAVRVAASERRCGGVDVHGSGPERPVEDATRPRPRAAC